LPLAPGFDFPVFISFHFFNNKAYFNATDGASAGEVWSTDGIAANTSLLKDIVPAPSFPIYFAGRCSKHA
jgi:ELWxxDGT repeat protein